MKSKSNMRSVRLRSQMRLSKGDSNTVCPCQAPLSRPRSMSTSSAWTIQLPGKDAPSASQTSTGSKVPSSSRAPRVPFSWWYALRVKWLFTWAAGPTPRARRDNWIERRLNSVGSSNDRSAHDGRNDSANCQTLRFPVRRATIRSPREKSMSRSRGVGIPPARAAATRRCPGTNWRNGASKP